MTRLTPAVFALLGSTFAASAALAAVQIDAPPPAAAAVQVGDGALSCQALSQEIASLSQAQVRKADAAARGRRLFGFASAALQMAGPMTGALGGGSSAASLIGAVAQQGAMSAMQAPAAPADVPPADGGRRDRLVALFDAKGC